MIILYYSVCHIAGEFGRFLKSQLEEAKYRKKWPHEEIEITENEIICLQIAGLCHDLGKMLYIASCISLMITIVFI